MSVTRRFLIVPSLGRLIRKERGGSRITEGYFAPQGGRISLVRIDGQQCHLVLLNSGENSVATEERTEVPRAHGDALMDVCGGKAVYERTTIALAPGRDAHVDRYVQPAGVDLVSVSFENADAAKSFRAPLWFGTEVSENGAYDRHAIGLNGPPETTRLGLNNAMLDALLDLLEPRFGLGRFGASAPAAGAPKPIEPAGQPGRAPSAATAALPVTAPLPVSAEAAEETSLRGGEQASPPAAADTLPLPAEPRPLPAPALSVEQAQAPADEPPAAPEKKTDNSKPDARIDDVIESLSQALGAAIQQPSDGPRQDDLAASFERWQVRPRRTQQ